jgi:hypothetical protein
MVVVVQPPKGGDGVTIHRDSSRPRIHLAVLFICDTRALYVTDQSAMTAWNHVPIYGNRRILCVRYTLC